MISEQDSNAPPKKVLPRKPLTRRLPSPPGIAATHVTSLAALLVGLLILLDGCASTSSGNKSLTVATPFSGELPFSSELLGVNPSPEGGYFEIKWYRLKQFIEKNGGVDVIVIGSSVVNTGIDPDIVAETYAKQTGTKLRIFNFGVESLDIVPNSVYAKILVQKYHPALLIFGTIPRDYLDNDGEEVNSLFLASPWIQYHSGKLNLLGWSIDTSVALHLFMPFRKWMRTDSADQQSKYNYRLSRTSASGYEPDHYIATNSDQHPDPSDPNEVDAFAKYHDFQVAADRLARLQDILDLQKIGKTQVIVIDMPLASTFPDYMGGQSVYQAYQQTLETTVAASGSVFIPANGDPAIPPDGHSDREHLNHIGAPVMSTFLGNQLAGLTKNNGMQFINNANGSK